MYQIRAAYALYPGARGSMVLFLMFLLLGACDENENLAWRPQIVSPLGFGSLGINDQPELRDIDFSLNLGLDLGVSGVFAPVPAFQNQSAGPETFQINDPVFVEIGIQELEFQGTLRNETPIALEAGAIITVRNVGETEALVQHITTDFISIGGSYTFSEAVEEGVVKPDLELFVENISSPGSSSPVRLLPSNLRIDFTISLPRVLTIVYPPQTVDDFTIESAFDIGIGDDLDNLEGDLGLVLESSFPVDFSVEVFFLNNNGMVLSSLTEAPIMIEAGSVANPSSQITVVNAAPVLNSLKDAEQIRVNGRFSTPNSGNVLIDTTNQVDFRLLANVIAEIETN